MKCICTLAMKCICTLSHECLNIITCMSVIPMYVWKGCTSSCVWLCVYSNSKSSQGKPECPTLGTVLSPLLQIWPSSVVPFTLSSGVRTFEMAVWNLSFCFHSSSTDLPTDPPMEVTVIVASVVVVLLAVVTATVAIYSEYSGSVVQKAVTYR